MNKMIRRTCSVICVLSMLSGITSCTPEKPDEKVISSIESEASSTASKPAPKADISGSHIRMTLDNNFIVDAEYSGMPETETGKIPCIPKQWEDEAIIKVFFKRNTPEIRNNTSGGKLIFNDSQKFDLFSNEYASYFIYQLNDFDRYGKVFADMENEEAADVEELEFMSSTDATELVKNSLEELGIESAVTDIKSFDTERLKSRAAEKDPFNKYKFMKEDELYFISMMQVFDSIPVHKELETEDGISAVVSSKGIEYLTGYKILQKTSGAEPQSTTCASAEKVLESFYSASGIKDLGDAKINVNKVEFMYWIDSTDDGSIESVSPRWEIYFDLEADTTYSSSIGYDALNCRANYIPNNLPDKYVDKRYS